MRAAFTGVAIGRSVACRLSVEQQFHQSRLYPAALAKRVILRADQINQKIMCAVWHPSILSEGCDLLPCWAVPMACRTGCVNPDRFYRIRKDPCKLALHHGQPSPFVE
jgi:hypothetical protein